MRKLFWAMCLGVSFGSAFAQELPKEISGRWEWPARRVGQAFSLENIQRTGASSFSATLTWWTINSRCTIQSEPITGQVSGPALAFDATTKCNDSFTAELKPAGERWEGKATTKTGVVVELHAK